MGKVKVVPPEVLKVLRKRGYLKEVNGVTVIDGESKIICDNCGREINKFYVKKEINGYIILCEDCLKLILSGA